MAYHIVGHAMQVHTQLGSGFLEKLHENALMVLFRKASLAAIQQSPITVMFEGEIVGTYYAELKAFVELREHSWLITI